MRFWANHTYLVAGGLLLHCLSMAAQTSTDSFRVYIGTYTGPKSQGIYTALFDPATGKLGQPELAAAVQNPTFLALHPNHRYLYAIGELEHFEGQHAGAVSAFRIEPGSGKLVLLNQQPSGGTGPCHLSVDHTGACVLVANYTGGSVAALPIDADGKLGKVSVSLQHHGSSVNPDRQAGPHAHQILPDPANRFALGCDLGLDKVFVYRLDPAQARLTPNAPPFFSVTPGSGPRHITFAGSGRVAYLINEMGSSLKVLDYDANAGVLSEIQTISTLPKDFKGQNIAAEVQVHPSGSFVYASNRGHDSIAVFAADSASGRLKLLEHVSCGGKTPRHFTFDPTGHWLLVENQDSNNIVVFRADAQSGHLEPTGERVQLGAPVCLIFLPNPS